MAMEELSGVMAIDCNEGAVVVTVNEVELAIEPEIARMVVLPAPVPVAKPAELIVAMAVFVELQETVPVRFWVVPSLYVPVAVYC
jgi:hypothetical protein